MIDMVPLCTITLDLAPSLAVGTGPSGDRSVGAVRTAEIRGERLSGGLAGPAAADWLVRTGAIGVIDARMTVCTHDDALIHVEYRGRLDLSNPREAIVARIAPLFETGDARYAWLNGIQAVGKGLLTLRADGAALAYDVFEAR